jgi:DNA-binding GntR family transcriptional regulator
MQVYAALRSDIDAGRLREGDRLSIGALCARFGVSRDTCRKAIEMISAERGVWFVDGLGWFVGCPPDTPPPAPAM